MGLLILHPTDMSQWYTLLSEAQSQAHLLLPEEEESYLVFLLMRFSKQYQLLESVMALEFLESLEDLPAQRMDRLQSIGDKSLLFCGLFPGMAEKRCVSLEYFANMGQQAYFIISTHYEHPHALLFAKLSERFMDLQRILQALRPVAPNGDRH